MTRSKILAYISYNMYVAYGLFPNKPTGPAHEMTRFHITNTLSPRTHWTRKQTSHKDGHGYFDACFQGTKPLIARFHSIGIVSAVAHEHNEQQRNDDRQRGLNCGDKYCP